MSKNDNSTSKGFLKALAMLSQMGIMIIVCIALGIFLGWLLDKWLGTSPWLLLLFTLFGIAAAIKSIVDFANRL